MKPSDSRKIEIWGLTGGIGAGKSTAARIFAELGVPTIDADVVVRELSAPGGAAHEAIARKFGTAEREKLRKHVFANPEARKELEAILHPLVARESSIRAIALGRLPENVSKNPFRCLYEAALLVETGRYKSLDGLIVIEAAREVRIDRVIARSETEYGHPLTRQEVEQIIDAQASDTDRRGAASWVIDNSDNETALRERILFGMAQRGWPTPFTKPSTRH